MKKYISLILALILVIAVFPLSSFAEDEIVTNGDISDTVHFTLDTAKKTLTIGGTGAIPAIPMNDVNPWSRNSYATTIIIETGITEIGDYAFYQNTYVKKVVMSDTVKKIGKSAFSGCKAITSLTLSGALESIGERAFINCTGISSITLAATLKRIEDSAFYGCSKITALSLPANLDYLDASAFTGTGYYKNLPSGLPVLDGYTLQYKGTPTGTTVTVPSGTRIISANTLASSSKVSTIEIPSSVEKILRMAFYDLTALHTVTVPDSVKEIGTFALGYVSDTTFAVPVPASSYKICGHVGSEAERYANECNFDFECACVEGDGTSQIIYPNCLTGGTAYVKCLVCGKTIRSYTVAAASSHSYSGQLRKPSTCLEKGKIYRKCTLCGYEAVETTLSLGDHTQSALHIIEPTCTEQGTYWTDCTVCGVQMSLAHIAPTGHTTDGSYTVTTEATCTSPGLKSQVCSKCGEIISSIEIPALEHNVPPLWTILVRSDISKRQTGLRARCCSRCLLIITMQDFVAGDLNGDGIISLLDVSAIKAFIAGVDDNFCENNSDANQDGVTNMQDIQALKEYIAG